MENSFGDTRQNKPNRFWPSKSEIRSALAHFSKREWLCFLILSAICLISTLGILNIVNNSFMTGVPMQGGTLSEGIIGTPRFVNPVLASSNADLDLVSLIYAGLMRKNPDGELMPDLAEKYEISSDGLTYTFILKENLSFHNDSPLSVNDIVFTIRQIQDPLIKSPRRASWEGVSISKIDERTIAFSLKQPYASFLENTTLGIMPEVLWSNGDNAPLELNEMNIRPIGSGPYKITGVGRGPSGVVSHYELSRFDKFSLGKPYVKELNLHFYSNEADLIAALEEGKVDQISSVTPENAKILEEKNYRVESSVLPRVFGLFFNHNQNQIFLDHAVIKAMDLAIDKERIVNEILSGYGVVIDDPIPPNLTAYQKLSDDDKKSREEGLEEAKNILAKDGWKIGESGFLEKTKTEKGKKTTSVLEFSISTGNAPELSRTALFIQQDLALVGMNVSVKTFEVGNLNQNVIRPRKYDALLFGQIINNESDLSAFWHSSQRKDPGLNVAMYTNVKVDKILEEAFVATDESERVKKYSEFEEEIKKDTPAVFLYSPNFLYVVSKQLQGFSINHVISPRDRFLNAHSWYTEVDKIWKIFTSV